ncbi:Uncharacterised protein g7721 [Pycnogonum litorale]
MASAMFDSINPYEKLLAFQDFVPIIAADKKYETLEKLVEKANLWLKLHPEFSVKLCETFNIKFHNGCVDPDRTSYIRKGQDEDSFFYADRNVYLRCLRLWLTPHRVVRQPVQIGIKTFSPKSLPNKENRFQSLDDTLKAINNSLSTHNIEGRIISAETKPVKFSGPKKFDSSKSKWSEPSDERKFYIFVIRIFFEIGEPVVETLHFKDFAPEFPMTPTGTVVYDALKAAEEFVDVFHKAQQWCENISGIRIANLHAIDIKMKVTNFEENRQKMSFTEHNERATLYWRALRIVCLSQSQSTHALNLSYKTFIPVPVTNKGQFEGINATFGRVHAWLSVVKRSSVISIQSVETIPIRLNTSGEKYFGAEAAWTVYKGARNERWNYVIRLYFEGTYTEPPLNSLPYVPPVLKKSSCIIQ